MVTRALDIAVLGAGPAGLATALSLAHFGIDVGLIAPAEAERKPDRRTTALLGTSVNFLENLDILRAVAPFTEPLDGIRIVDDRGGLLRAPELLFRARELGLASFGLNVENQVLVTALLRAVAASPRIARIEAAAADIVCDADAVVLTLTSGERLTARLLAAADGRNSLARKAASIPVQTWSYPQSALAVSFRHARMHQGVSTELHRRAGPFTSVPLPGKASSLVWVETPATADAVAKLDDDALCRRLEDELQGLLGAITEPGARGVFPLSGLTARKLGTRRVALIGEAGHVMPPIGAQGLNLGFRDAATLAEVVRDAVARGEDPGREAVLARYDSWRKTDVVSRQVSIDVLNRSLLSDFLPVQALRGIGLHLLANLPVLRDRVMRAGLGPGGPQPALLGGRGNAVGSARPAIASP